MIRRLRKLRRSPRYNISGYCIDCNEEEEEYCEDCQREMYLENKADNDRDDRLVERMEID